ncbi:unnamed protein product [Tilletia controversa]|uniref:Cutinase n=3 Tax=Tilletia TaxID=13289 RepID=A0A8X7SWM8_9BASI|nr:hypothetical protein CF336_g1587 [Tilletia laevis]KAE8202281.1 hypothetical protein CF328_g2300 [Tilletia controversa]KAE8264173.1 hypothetical protein A4X03_0g1136 [Tilletia caries]KAE8207613.1 hypothetical protein CF335_g1017 [Tilletia laevis]KAE8246736.1 hypothetical protein A4X06_0g4898 [Tilletia controversa]
MRFIPSLTLALATLTVACTAAPMSFPPTRPTPATLPTLATCKDYVLISSRGTQERQGPSFIFKDIIKDVLQALPNGAEVDTVYPADWGMHFEIGSDWIFQYITKSLASCPQQKFALLGWSQGAMVSSGAIQKFAESRSAAKNSIKAAVFFGNPFHVPHRVGNVDEHGQFTTSAVSGIASYGNPNAATSFAQQGKLLDICFEGDTICNRARSSDPAAHGKYGARPQITKMSVDFLLKHLRE